MARLIEELKNLTDLAQADDDTTIEEIKELRRTLCSAFHVRNFSRDNKVVPCGSEKETKIQNYFMPPPSKEGP